MHQLAKGYTDEQIDAVAGWFAAQKASNDRGGRHAHATTRFPERRWRAGCEPRSRRRFPAARRWAAARGKVVVVGGGYGGATAAKYIRMWSDGAIDVTLVEPDASFISCPLSNLVLGGSKTLADITVSYDGLARNARREARPRHGDRRRCRPKRP